MHIAVLEQTPTALPSLLLDLSPRVSLLSGFKLPQALHLLKHMLKQVFSSDNIEMPADFGVFAGEPVDLGL
jgi:hypothetical protein